MRLIDLLKAHGLIVSTSDARRLATLGAVTVNGKPVDVRDAAGMEVEAGDVVRVGKRSVAVIEDPMPSNLFEMSPDEMSR